MSKPCETCGLQFKKRPQYSYRQWEKARFCSRACFIAADRVKPAVDLCQFFADNIFPEPNSGCWLWIGSVGGEGYGQLCINRWPQRAHRVSYELHVGPIPKGKSVLHKCDVRLCVNPEHLYLGTVIENCRDMVARGRSLIGSRNPSAKLTDDIVREIRASDLPDSEFARQLGMSREAIKNARRGHTWGHVV